MLQAIFPQRAVTEQSFNQLLNLTDVEVVQLSRKPAIGDASKGLFQNELDIKKLLPMSYVHLSQVWGQFQDEAEQQLLSRGKRISVQQTSH